MEKKSVNPMYDPMTGGIYYSKTGRSNPVENEDNSLNPLYRPVPSKLTNEQRVEKILSVGEECLTAEEVKKLVDSGKFIYCYDGFEPSGRMHIAQGILKTINVNKLVDSGCIFIFWVADWFAMLNNKMGGDLTKIRVIGQYFIEIWKAAGMKMSNVKFVWASDFINKRPNDYWLQVMNIGCKYSLNRVKRCSTIMGREESDDLKVSQMIYPLMQATDVFFLDVDICQLGIDQRKVNILAIDYCNDTHREKKPVILSHHMICGLLQGEEKMSKSSGSAIFMEDSEADVNQKIKGAFCEPGNIKENPPLEYVKYFVFDTLGEFVVEREEKFGGNVTYKNFEDVVKDFESKALFPKDLKNGLAKAINKILDPVRNHFKNDPEANRIFQLVKQYKKEADDLKLKETGKQPKANDAGNKNEGQEKKKEPKEKNAQPKEKQTGGEEKKADAKPKNQPKPDTPADKPQA